MNLGLGIWGGIAFSGITLAVLVYLCVLGPILNMLSLPHVLGHFVAVWLPVLLSFVAYISLYRDKAQHKGWLYLQASATAVLAPFLAWQFYLFMGFAFLGWQL